MAVNQLNVRYILCNDVTANWDIATKILLKGELAAEFRAEGAPKFKMGDGVNLWADLPYITLTPPEINTLISNIQTQIGSLSNLEAIRFAANNGNLVAAINKLSTDLGALEDRVDTAEDDIESLEGRVDDLEAATDKDVYMTRSINASNNVVYTLYQGDAEIQRKADTQSATYVSSIEIARDMVLDDADIVVYADGDTFPEGVTTAGTYIKFVFQGTNKELYLNVGTLIDIYTAQAQATEVQLAISATNEISATIVAKSISKAKLDDEVKELLTKSLHDVVVAGTNSSVTNTTYSDTITVDGQSVTVTKNRATINTISTDIIRNGTDTLVLNGGTGDAVATP